MEIHIAAKGRESKLHLRAAAKEIVKKIPDWFSWCRMLIAPVRHKSVYNLCLKVGFTDTGEYQFTENIANIMVVKYE